MKPLRILTSGLATAACLFAAPAGALAATAATTPATAALATAATAPPSTIVTSSSTPAETMSSAPSGQPPAAPPGGGTGGGGAGGAPGGGGGGTATVTALGTWTVDSGTQTSSGQTYDATADNTSGILLTGGTTTVTDATVTTSGASTSSDESSFYGLNAGVLVKNAALTMTGGTVSTTGDGANGIFAYGTANVTLDGVTVDATGKYAHGIMASGGGTITATNVNASTTSSNGAVIATDRGGGTINVTGGTYTTAGTDSPGLYSTGTINVTGATVTATGAEAAVIEGSNTITVKDTTISGAAKSGVMLYQSMSGDASGSDSSYTQTGGSLSAAAGPLFYVTNATGTVHLDGVTTTATSGILLNAAAASWGTSGSNGGNAVLDAKNETLSGDITADAISTVAVTLTDSTWTGALDNANTAASATLTLAGTSTWSLSADSHVGTLTGAAISGTAVSNIAGNGHTLYYDSAANPDLGGTTFTLAGGGTLQPDS